jgi:hypothetical protein
MRSPGRAYWFITLHNTLLMMAALVFTGMNFLRLSNLSKESCKQEASQDEHLLQPMLSAGDCVNKTVEKINQVSNICAIVRTHPGQSNILPITVLSLTQQSDPSIGIEVFLVNTDPNQYETSDFMHHVASDANCRNPTSSVIVIDGSFHQNPPIGYLYGYDVTDRVLEQHILGKASCQYILVTNGDNFYSKNFFRYIKSSVLSSKQLIAWDFTTHHKREYNVIHTEIVLGKIDLGAALVATTAINSTNARFVFKENMDGDTAYALDFFFMKNIHSHFGDDGVEIIHQVLFAHQ